MKRRDFIGRITAALGLAAAPALAQAARPAAAQPQSADGCVVSSGYLALVTDGADYTLDHRMTSTHDDGYYRVVMPYRRGDPVYWHPND